MSQATASLPKLGAPAPHFAAESTHGPIALDSPEFEGKWIVLLSHPYDFTPVCSTEMVALAERAGEFDELGVQLIGLSVDSKFSHIAWMRALERDHGTAIPFPLISDVGHQVAQAYGMVHPGASDMATVRAVFVIDPERTVRAMIYYPLTTGRSVDEILRITRALVFVDTHPDTACPAGWEPGDAVILPPPPTAAAAAQRLAEEADNPDAKDWYFVKKKRPA